MAELALGSIEVAFRPKARSNVCGHESNLTVTASGVERSICETCGHISVSFISEVSGPVARNRFTRRADEHDGVPIHRNPFSSVEQFGLTRRPEVDVRSLLLTA